MKKEMDQNPEKTSILVVDDMPDNLRILVEILKEQNFHIRPARNGRVALNSAFTSPPDLILLDIIMAPPNGYEVCEQLKKDARTRHIPIIFISGLNETTDKIKAFEVGGVDFITKPFEPAEVIARINTHLNIKKLASKLEQNNRKLASEIAERKKAYEKTKQLQQALEQNNRELELRVKKEMEKHRNQQQILIQRSKLESLGELAAGMAHEINQPLTGISMGLDNIVYKVLSGTIKPQYIQDKFETLQEHVNRIKKIINHIRIFSREQSSEHVATVDAERVCHNAISMVQHQYMHHGIEILFTHTEESCLVTANMYKLEQVLLNLLSNARDAIQSKHLSSHAENNLILEKRIAIHLACDASHVHIKVKDSGSGMETENMDKIFNPFYTTKSPEQGTGLGLSISYGIIKEFNGNIEVQSAPGRGTIMSISLPRLLHDEKEAV